MNTRKYICPACKKREGVDILYGSPSFEMFEAAERGEIELGGCVIDGNQPERKCLSCEHEWRIKRRNPLPPMDFL